jgi:2-iminobutanoate/2-iminopropanoate deaminase
VRSAVAKRQYIGCHTIPIDGDGMDSELKSILTSEAPRPVGPYSQAIVVGNLVFCSGQIGIEPSSGNLEMGITAQTERCLKNLEGVLREAGASKERVVRCTIYLIDISKFKKVNSVYSSYFSGGPLPSRVTVGVASLPLGAEVEIDLIAVLGHS